MPPPAAYRDDILDTLTRHQVYIQRLAGGYVNDILPSLQRAARDIERLIKSEISPGNLVKYRMIESEIKEIIGKITGKVDETTGTMFQQLPPYEGAFVVKALGDAMTISSISVAKEQLITAATQSPMRLVSGQRVEMLTIDEMLRRFDSNAVNEVGTAIRTGIITGKSTPEIAREVRTLVEGRTRRQAETIVRTATNHAASEAKSIVYAENADLLEFERFVATLDFRTTITCAGLDGKTFQVGSGPVPPLHFGCRSVRVPSIKEKYRVPGMKMRRATKDGPVDARVTYGGWLKRQPAKFQDDVLGPTRAKLFREGKVSIDGFTDDAGRVLNLNQLAQIEGIEIK